MSTMDNKQFQWWFLLISVYFHSYIYSPNVKLLKSGGGSHQFRNNFLQTLSVLLVDWILCYDIWNTNPSYLWSQCPCGIKIKESKFIYLHILPNFSVKNWVLRQMSLAQLILNDLTWLALTEILACCVWLWFTLSHIKPGNMMLQVLRNVLNLLLRSFWTTVLISSLWNFTSKRTGIKQKQHWTYEISLKHISSTEYWDIAGKNCHRIWSYTAVATA